MAPLSMEFSRQEYRNGLPFPSLEDLPDPGTEPGSPALQADSLPSEPLGKNRLNKIKTICIHLEADCKPHKDSYLFEPVSPTLNVKDSN